MSGGDDRGPLASTSLIERYGVQQLVWKVLLLLRKNVVNLFVNVVRSLDLREHSGGASAYLAREVENRPRGNLRLLVVVLDFDIDDVDRTVKFVASAKQICISTCGRARRRTPDFPSRRR